ncbi:MAG: T9SS type A sorting domain-containing protein [Candidatus Cloacimonetes bacterium]|nr:T9SS type A sorting domain-containing protein [Candidatus Cloacimonadota bacterium]
MKKLLTVLLVVVIASVLFADNAVKVKMADPSPFSRQNALNRDFITITEEDFESGATDWTHYDETAPTDWNEAWHLSTVGAYAGQSWWMGDEDLVGYTDHRYLVLDTPTLTLAAANPELSFMFALSCEDPGSSPPYDAWDGANVRISTDGGNTWDVIAGTPAYNGTSFYSFGYEFNEGTGIAGWGSTTNWVNWTQATFDLSAYAGDAVKIRFAFASDPAYNTGDDPDMFGFRVDDISVDVTGGTFLSNGDGAAGDTQMVPGYGGSVVGDLWHLYEDTMAPSPTNAMGCFDDGTGTYLPGMSDFIISPEFFLPEEGIFSWDVYVETMLDAGTFPDCDYIHVEVCSQLPGEAWTSWYSISNPLGDPNGDNYVFTGSIDTWSLFTEGWGLEYGDLSLLAGRNVKFRFGLHSNTTSEVVPGGFRIDNFYVMQEVYLGPAPENLIAITNEDDQVDLTWDPISVGGEEGWLQWDSGVNDDGIGITGGGSFWVAASFDQSDLMPYIGGSFTELEVYIRDLPSVATAYIWEGNLAANELLTQAFTPVADSWNTITLDTPIEIESGSEYWVGYYVTHGDAQFPAGVDAGPGIVGKGDWIAQTAGAWNSLVGYGLDYNWNIHAYVEASGRRLPVFAGNNRDRDITGYNVWRSAESGGTYENIATVDPSNDPMYLDEEPLDGAWNYYVVTALYDGLDGAASNEAMAYVIDEAAVEIAYDDGTAEEGINVGIAQYMAVRFTPAYPSSRQLSHIKVFIETMNTGQFVFRILDDDSGAPGAQLAQFNITPDNLHVGWNTIEIPENQLENVVFESGSFFVSIFEMASLSALGKDTDTSGQSWITVQNMWEEVTDGNIMIRVIVGPTVGGDSEELAPAVATISNFPNPFNPETTIEMNIPVAGQATLKIYNTRGQLVKNLLDDVRPAGLSSVTWNGTDNSGTPVTSGIYFYQLETGNQTTTRKMIMLK